MVPNDEKWARKSSRMTGWKKDLGRGVTARVLVRMISGDCSREDTIGLLSLLGTAYEGIFDVYDRGTDGERIEDTRKLPLFLFDLD